MQIEPSMLEGRFVRLEPIAPGHRDAPRAPARNCHARRAFLEEQRQAEGFAGWLIEEELAFLKKRKNFWSYGFEARGRQRPTPN
jgi:hypothetical protein